MLEGDPSENLEIVGTPFQFYGESLFGGWAASGGAEARLSGACRPSGTSLWAQPRFLGTRAALAFAFHQFFICGDRESMFWEGFRSGWDGN